MNTIAKSRLLSTVVILLLLANMTTMAIFWWKKEKSPADPPGRKESPGGASAFLIKELGFDSLQQKAYQQLKAEHQQNMRQVKENVHKAKDALFALLNKDSVNATELEKASAEAAKQTQREDMLTFEHFKKIKALCNAAQKKKLEDIIQQALRMMAPQQGPPQRNGPPGAGAHPPGDRPPPPADGEKQPPPEQ